MSTGTSAAPRSALRRAEQREDRLRLPVFCGRRGLAPVRPGPGLDDAHAARGLAQNLGGGRRRRVDPPAMRREKMWSGPVRDAFGRGPPMPSGSRPWARCWSATAAVFQETERSSCSSTALASSPTSTSVRWSPQTARPWNRGSRRRSSPHPLHTGIAGSGGFSRLAAAASVVDVCAGILRHLDPPGRPRRAFVLVAAQPGCPDPPRVRAGSPMAMASAPIAAVRATGHVLM